MTVKNNAGNLGSRGLDHIHSHLLNLYFKEYGVFPTKYDLTIDTYGQAGLKGTLMVDTNVIERKYNENILNSRETKLPPRMGENNIK